MLFRRVKISLKICKKLWVLPLHTYTCTHIDVYGHILVHVTCIHAYAHAPTLAASHPVPEPHNPQVQRVKEPELRDCVARSSPCHTPNVVCVHSSVPTTKHFPISYSEESEENLLPPNPQTRIKAQSGDGKSETKVGLALRSSPAQSGAHGLHHCFFSPFVGHAPF